MWTPVERNDARVVDLLGKHDNVARGLENLIRAIVATDAALKQAAWHTPRDAPPKFAVVFPRVFELLNGRTRSPFADDRHAPVGRIHYEGASFRAHGAKVKPAHPAAEPGAGHSAGTLAVELGALRFGLGDCSALPSRSRRV